MTGQGSGRGRKPKPGRITFVGSGPGDPGLLTTRARTVLANAALVFTDPDVPEAVLALVGFRAAAAVRARPAATAKAADGTTDAEAQIPMRRRPCGACGSEFPAAPTSGRRSVIRPRWPRRWPPRPARASTWSDWWRAIRCRWTR